MQPPTPQSVSPARIPPAPMAKTAILPSSAMRSPITTLSAIQGLNWTQIPGAASAIAASPDGSLWALSTGPSGPDKYIWHYSNGSWTNITGLAQYITVAPNGTLYAIGAENEIYSNSGNTCGSLPATNLALQDPLTSPGGTISGFAACFQIPANEASSLVLFANPLCQAEVRQFLLFVYPPA